MIKIFFSTTFVVLLVQAARLTDSKVKHKISEDKILIEVDKGFHINEKAPITLKFFVCDDKNTVCEQHEIKPTLKK